MRHKQSRHHTSVQKYFANIPEVERSQTSQRNVELADTVSLYRNSVHAIKKDAFPPDRPRVFEIWSEQQLSYTIQI